MFHFPPRGDELPIDVLGHSHFQSVVRPQFVADDPSFGDARWLVASKSGSPGLDPIEPVIRNTGLYFYHLTFASEGDEAWSFDPPDLATVVGGLRYFYDLYEPGLNHVGGMHALGDVLAVAVEDNEDPSPAPPRPAEIRMFDIRTPGAISELHRLVLDGSRGEPLQTATASRAGAVAMTMLADARRLMVVLHHDRIWVYITDRSELTAFTRWQFVDSWSATDAGVRWSSFENLALVNECATGEVFLIGMGESANVAALYRMVSDEEHAVAFEWIGEGEFDSTHCELGRPGVSFRWGSSIYLDASAEMSAYAIVRSVADFGLDQPGGGDTVCLNQW